MNQFLVHEITRNIFVVQMLLVSYFISSIKSKLLYICMRACVCIIRTFKWALHLHPSRATGNITAIPHHPFHVRSDSHLLHIYLPHLFVSHLTDRYYIYTSFYTYVCILSSSSTPFLLRYDHPPIPLPTSNLLTPLSLIHSPCLDCERPGERDR